MTSVAAGIGILAYGASDRGGAAFIGPAQAQATKSVGAAAQPTGFADIIERVKPAVISVKVSMKDKATDVASRSDDEQGSSMERFFRRFGDMDGMPKMPHREGRGPVSGQGSGFFISADGYAVTNNHVVDGAEKVEVTTDAGATYTAKVIGTDPRTDLALIKVDGGPAFPFAKMSEGKPRVGDWVLAVGNPFGLGGTVTAGIVSASGRDIGSGPYDDFLQIDAPVNKGNSGGPTFNTNGEVVGVNTAIYSPSGGNVGIAFAIPAPSVTNVVAQLKDKGTVERGWIGVQVQPVTQDIADSMSLKQAQGALVAEPQKDGPAAKAGIVAGDVITAVNGKPVKDSRELAKTIGGFAPGSTVKLDVLNKGKNKVVSLTLGELPNAQEANAGKGEGGSTGATEMPQLGMTLAPTGKSDGVVVSKVDPKGAAAERGLKQGDVILEVAGKSVTSPDQVREAVQTARADKKNNVLMRLRSGESSRYVAMPVAQG